MSTAAVSATVPTFAEAARKVCLWVVLRRWLSVLRLTVVPATLVLVLLMLALLRGKALLVAPWLGLLLWLAGSLAYAWWRRPQEYSALALWDAAAGRREAFASAWWFEQRVTEGGETARQHVAAQLAALPGALPRLRRELPLQPDRWLLLPLAIAVLGSLVSVVTAPADTTMLVDEAMARRATEEARKLAQTDWAKKKMEGLTDEEKKQLEDLKQKVQKTADDLANAAGKDARSVLAELERRARDAEKMAEELDATREAWASAKMVQALRDRTDTADLGDAVAAKNAKSAAQAAKGLAEQLKSPQLPAETRQRLNDTLQEAQKQADDADHKRMVGQNVLAAGEEMQKGNAAGAGAEFDKLASKLRDLELREQARKELQDLAQQLRESGSGIAGENGQQGAMQQMSQAGQSGAQPQGGQNGSTPQMSQAQAPQPGQQPLAPPGLDQGQQNQMQSQPQQQGGQGQSGQQMMMAQPGQGSSNGQNQPGAQQGMQSAEGTPMLLAPVPGQPPPSDPKAPVVIIPGQPDGANPGGVTISSPTPGGIMPAQGTAELNNVPTAAQKTAQESLVKAQQNAEGRSTTRSVEGAPHVEQSGRSATQTALDAIAAEEAALDEAALPPARREQVRRYFNELRKRFEKP